MVDFLIDEALNTFYTTSIALVYKTIGITTRSDLEKKDLIVEKIVSILIKAGARVLLDPKRCEAQKKYATDILKPDSAIDVLIVIGGDGTILRSLREMQNFDVPLLTINRGTIGFLAELSLHESHTLLPDFLQGKEGKIEERHLLHVRVIRGTEERLSCLVLNDAVISQGAISRLIDVEATVSSNPLTTFHADGVILATPTGSTAYSLSAGGPIVHPELAATIITPINPHSFSQKPIVLPSSEVIEMKILAKNNKFGDAQVSLTLDGQTYVALQAQDRVIVQGAEKTAKFLRRKKDTYFSTLRAKLKWGERLEE